MARPVVDLPQPDSPTRPRVSPRKTSKVRPSTARTAPTLRCTMMPLVIGKWTLRPSMDTSASPSAAAVTEEMVSVSTPISGYRRRRELV